MECYLIMKITQQCAVKITAQINNAVRSIIYNCDSKLSLGKKEGKTPEEARLTKRHLQNVL